MAPRPKSVRRGPCSPRHRATPLSMQPGAGENVRANGALLGKPPAGPPDPVEKSGIVSPLGAEEYPARTWPSHGRTRGRTEPVGRRRRRGGGVYALPALGERGPRFSEPLVTRPARLLTPQIHSPLPASPKQSFHHRAAPINGALGGCAPVPIRDSLHAKASTSSSSSSILHRDAGETSGAQLSALFR